MCTGTVNTPRWPSPPVPGTFGFPVGFASGIVATILMVAGGATRHPMWSVIALAAVVAGVSAVSTLAASASTAAVCWCLHDGFVLGRQGALISTAASGQAAVVLALTAVVVLAVAAMVRTVWLRLGADRHGRTTLDVPLQPRGTPAVAGGPRRHDVSW